MKIAVGTESKQKLRYINEVIEELGINAEIIPYKAVSGVPSQPLTSQDTLTGATNRAQDAWRATPSADYGIGIEVGYDKDAKGRYEIFCWSVVIDKQGKLSKTQSHSFLLPDFHQSILNDEKEVGDHVKDYFSIAPDSVTQYVAEVVRSRKLFITESLRYALIYALHREFYSKN